jgi:hypothetical protein
MGAWLDKADKCGAANEGVTGAPGVFAAGVKPARKNRRRE